MCLFLAPDLSSVLLQDAGDKVKDAAKDAKDAIGGALNKAENAAGKAADKAGNLVSDGWVAWSLRACPLDLPSC